MTKALPPPSGPVSFVTRTDLARALAASHTSARGRMIQPFHRSDASSLHRMFNAIQPGSYIAPHRHLSPPKDEAWIVLQGALAFFTFDAAGKLETIAEVRANSEVFGVDLEAGVYHALYALEPDTVVYEVKSGPYAPHDDKSFAPWAPREGEPGTKEYLAELERAFTQRLSTKSA